MLKSPLPDGTLASQKKEAQDYNAFTLGGTDLSQEPNLVNQLEASGKANAQATEVRDAYKEVKKAQGLGSLGNSLNDRVQEEEEKALGTI